METTQKLGLRPAPHPKLNALALASALACLSASCASVSFERDSETSGTFRSSGVGFTILSFDFPKSSINIARENASDARQPDMQVTDEVTFPYLGPLDWILDIVSFRYSRIKGTWGFPPDTTPSD